MAHIPHRRVLSRCGDSHRGSLQAGPSGESSTPISISFDSGTLPTHSPMALGSPIYHLEEEASLLLGGLGGLCLFVMRMAPKSFRICVASHPLALSLCSWGGVGFLFFTYVARVMGVIPPFSAFTMAFLNCVNVCLIQLDDEFVRITPMRGSHPSWLHESECQTFLSLVWMALVIEESNLNDIDQDAVARLSRNPWDTWDVVVVIVLASSFRFTISISKYSRDRNSQVLEREVPKRAGQSFGVN
ncbi:uncharacterized protein G2W53_040994 [Senna tora]|uniref:Uncharacterized protein n=1 Tax=Senna tora TaxID=362788 RepID=A0A834SGM9_9FABA|nr:uncharacterized protein G2W53_040994 [Senna tora]